MLPTGSNVLCSGPGLLSAAGHLLLTGCNVLCSRHLLCSTTLPAASPVVSQASPLCSGSLLPRTSSVLCSGHVGSKLRLCQLWDALWLWCCSRISALVLNGAFEQTLEHRIGWDQSRGVGSVPPFFKRCVARHRMVKRWCRRPACL